MKSYRTPKFWSSHSVATRGIIISSLYFLKCVRSECIVCPIRFSIILYKATQSPQLAEAFDVHIDRSRPVDAQRTNLFPNQPHMKDSEGHTPPGHFPFPLQKEHSLRVKSSLFDLVTKTCSSNMIPTFSRSRTALRSSSEIFANKPHKFDFAHRVR
jgi:hypothetical protein